MPTATTDPIHSYSGAHERVHRLWGSASRYLCTTCRGRASTWAYDGTDPDEKRGHDWYSQRRDDAEPMPYSSWPEFYMPLCRSCHKTRDLRSLGRPPAVRPKKKTWSSHFTTPKTAAEWAEWQRSNGGRSW